MSSFRSAQAISIAARFGLNDEANLDVLDGNFAGQQIRLFEQDKKQSRPVTADESGSNALQHAADLVAPQL